VLRVLRPGGSLVVVANDYRWGQFADLLAASAAGAPPRTAAAWLAANPGATGLSYGYVLFRVIR
jgi:hypothetical protein